MTPAVVTVSSSNVPTGVYGTRGAEVSNIEVLMAEAGVGFVMKGYEGLKEVLIVVAFRPDVA
jgi:hypothetical protein